MGLASVLAIRLVAPLAVLRWRLAGALLAIAADAIDIVIFQMTDFPSFGYHQTDKLLDMYCLALFLFVTMRWESSVRVFAAALLAYRATGVVLYEVTDARVLLFVFPNVFEFFYLFNAARLSVARTYAMSVRRCVLWTAVLLVPKLGQEYALHYAEWLDQWVAADIIEATFRAVPPG